MSSEPLDIALRAWALPEGWAPSEHTSRRHKPKALVVLDCETETHGQQRLIVACYRYVRVSWKRSVPTFRVAEEGLVVPDDTDEASLSLVRRYASSHHPNTDEDVHETNPQLVVLTRHQFCERLLWNACWRNRATLVGFNLAFDISRLVALRAHGGRGRHSGAFVLRLWAHEGADNRFRPNVVARRLDNKRTLFSWSGVVQAPDDARRHKPGDDHFLDLRTLSFALTNEAHSLESACSTFGVPYEKREVTLGTLSEELIDYVREDVAATTDLAHTTLRVFHRHPVPLSADRAHSPAAIGLAYFEKMGVRPPLVRSDITPTRLAQAMAAFYGPRVEVRIRHHPVPVTLLDFSSQYANVARLLGIFDLLRSEKLRVAEATEEVRGLLAAVDIDGVLDPSTWPGLVGVALVRPDGDWLPSRAWFAGHGDVPRVGSGPLTSDRPLWFSIADLIAAKLLTGNGPEVISAWRIVGEGTTTLRPVLLAGRVRFDPNKDDWWAALIAARHKLGDDPLADSVKGIGNTTAYGSSIRMDQQGKEGVVTVHRPEGGEYRRRVARPELPHRWAFPPFATAVTGGGRLLMATLERLLIDRSGCWASANTDSATVVSSEDGRLLRCTGGYERLPDGAEAVKALSWEEVDNLRARFEPLGVQLNVTPENYRATRERCQLQVLGVAGSRVILYIDTPEGRQIVKRSEVALGDLRSPLGPGTRQTFVDEAAAWMLDRIVDGPGDVPDWFAVRATTELPMGTPGKVESLGEQGSAFGFAMGARRARRAGHVLGRDPVRLVAPAGDDPERTRWVEVPTGAPARTRTSAERAEPGDVVVATNGEEVVRLLLHPESKMLRHDGERCAATTKGLLAPRPVCVGAVHLVGKEGNRIDEISTGEVIDAEDVLIDYGDDSWERLVLPYGKAIGVRRLHRATGISLSQLSDLLNGRAMPQDRTRSRITAEVAALATSELGVRWPARAERNGVSTALRQSR